MIETILLFLALAGFVYLLYLIFRECDRAVQETAREAHHEARQADQAHDGMNAHGIEKNRDFNNV